jgi:ribonuclease D
VARELPDAELPATGSGSDGPPPAHRWADRDPAAAARLARARAAMTVLATEHNLPTENLLSPDSLRRLAWSPPDPADAEAVSEVLRGLGAREWQIAITAAPIAAALGT